MSAAGRWAPWYSTASSEPKPYGQTRAYQLGADWLADCARVEDWGCGLGWMRTLIPPERYWGIDGTPSPFADQVVDLAEFRSQTPGLFMRGVLEHNFDWQPILDNALASFTQRMVLVLFTPMAERTGQIADVPELGVPDISFAPGDITGRFGPDVAFHHIDITSATGYGVERIYYLERR